jgi:hypothetical protein
LKSMAAVRARTMHKTTRTKVRTVGRPSAATSSAPRAKGSAKMVCEKRIKRRKRVTTFGAAGSIGTLAMLVQQQLQPFPGTR